MTVFPGGSIPSLCTGTSKSTILVPLVYLLRGSWLPPSYTWLVSHPHQVTPPLWDLNKTPHCKVWDMVSCVAARSPDGATQKFRALAQWNEQWPMGNKLLSFQELPQGVFSFGTSSGEVLCAEWTCLQSDVLCVCSSLWINAAIHCMPLHHVLSHFFFPHVCVSGHASVQVPETVLFVCLFFSWVLLSRGLVLRQLVVKVVQDGILELDCSQESEDLEHRHLPKSFFLA